MTIPSGPRSTMAWLANLIERAERRDPRIDWPGEFVRAGRFFVGELNAYDRELAEFVAEAIERRARSAMGDAALPESVPFRRVALDSFEWEPRPDRPWGPASKANVLGIPVQVRGGMRWSNGREAVVLATGPNLDTVCTVPVEWFDHLTREARGDGEKGGGGDGAAVQD